MVFCSAITLEPFAFGLQRRRFDSSAHFWPFERKYSWFHKTNRTCNQIDSLDLSLLTAKTSTSTVKQIEDLRCRSTKGEGEERLFFLLQCTDYKRTRFMQVVGTERPDSENPLVDLLRISTQFQGKWDVSCHTTAPGLDVDSFHSSYSLLHWPNCLNATSQNNWKQKCISMVTISQTTWTFFQSAVLPSILVRLSFISIYTPISLSKSAHHSH